MNKILYHGTTHQKLEDALFQFKEYKDAEHGKIWVVERPTSALADLFDYVRKYEPILKMHIAPCLLFIDYDAAVQAGTRFFNENGRDYADILHPQSFVAKSFSTAGKVTRTLVHTVEQLAKQMLQQRKS